VRVCLTSEGGGRGSYAGLSAGRLKDARGASRHTGGLFTLGLRGGPMNELRVRLFKRCIAPRSALKRHRDAQITKISA